MLKIHKKLEIKLKKINKIPFVNTGGCGVVAYYIYQYLRRNGYKSRIIGYDREYQENKRNIMLNSKDCSFAHVVVYCGIWKIDSKGIDKYKINKNYSSRGSIVVPAKNLRLFNSNRDNWNSTFDRKHVSLIKQIL